MDVITFYCWEIIMIIIILLFDDRNGVKAIRSTFLVVEPTFLELEVSQTNYDKAL